MKFSVYLLISLIFISLFDACQPIRKQPKKLSEALRTTAMVTYENFGRHVPQTGTFSWLPEGTHSLKDPRLRRHNLDGMLRQAIVVAMQRKGYSFSQTGQVDLHIGYVAAMASDLDDRQIRELYGFDTGWQPTKNPKKYEKGSLILDIIQTQSHRHIWRGAIQANVGFDLSDSVRRQRTNKAVSQLLSRFNP